MSCRLHYLLPHNVELPLHIVFQRWDHVCLSPLTRLLFLLHAPLQKKWSHLLLNVAVSMVVLLK